MLIFVGTVVLSLVLTFAIGLILYRTQAENLIEENLIDSGKKIVEIYESSPPAELIPFLRNMADISDLGMQLYGPDGNPMLDERELLGRVPPEHVRLVLAGGISRGLKGRERHKPIIGLPLQAHGEKHALFLMWKSESIPRSAGKDYNIAQFIILMVLFIGSLLILIAARYIVNPLKRLTSAARSMARGHFEVEIHTKRKDEIGQLTSSFNEMAGELAKLDRMRQEFVTSVSHEIQTPLQSITGFTKALKQKQKQLSEERRSHYLSIIESESERLSRLSRNLLRLSSLQHELQPHELHTFRLDEQLRRTAIALEPQWQAKSISVELKLEPIVARADEDQLGQVWTNLLGNGIKFASERGVLHIEAAVRGDHAVVSVTDNGPGIPEEELSDIFKPFHKVDKSRDSAMGGSGLGLSIAKRIVDLHRGEIEAKAAPGGGTTLTVRLPQHFPQQSDEIGSRSY